MGLSVKWLGHASFQIRADCKIIFIDPYEGSYVDKADLVLVSHSHHDHCDPSKIEQIRKRDTVIIGPADCASKIEGKIKVLEPGEKTEVGKITVQAVPAYNYKRFRSPGVPFHPKGSGVGYLITAGGKTTYYAGDTDFIPEMHQLKNIDLALLPTGDKYTMDNAEAAEAANAIKPKTAMAMHTWEKDREEFKKKAEANSKTQVVLLQEGEEYQLK